MTDKEGSMAEHTKPNIPVLPWPAVATPTPDEVYAGEADAKKEYALWLESALRQSENFKKPEALDRIRVLDCTSNMIIGHWCSSLFAEKGAEGVVVEAPGRCPRSRPRWVCCGGGCVGQGGPRKERAGTRAPPAQAACGFVPGTGA